MNVIHQTLQFLKAKVDAYNSASDDNSIVEIANIAALNDGDEFLSSTTPIILSIVNIEEDNAAKSPRRYFPLKEEKPITVKNYKNPAQSLILSLLFSSYNQEQTTDKYQDGIVKLEQVIRCFQEQNVFYIDGTTEITDPENEKHIKIILDLESLKISELNQLWSMLGNKYMPSVLYKMRMIAIQGNLDNSVTAISKLNINLHDSPDKDTALSLETQTTEIN